MAGALEPYPSPEERQARLDALAAALGGEVRTLGHSVEGRPIRAARIPRAGAGEESVLVCAGIHGVEFIGTMTALGFLEALRDPTPELARLRERAEVWVLPSLNPDAYARTWAWEGRGELADLRTNARGVDLNRNYPRPGAQRPVWITFGGWRTGSDEPSNAFYRGTGPFSEPETAALESLLTQVPFAASANLHSTMGSLIPPFVTTLPEQKAYRTLCGAFRRGQRRHRYFRMAAPSVDLFMGEQEDHQHHVHRTWSICVEHYPLYVDAGRFLRRQALFWRFNPRDPSRWVRNDLPGIVAYFHAALDVGRPDRVP